MQNIKPKEQKAISQAQTCIRQGNAIAARDIMQEYARNNKLSEFGLYWLCLGHAISGDPAKAKNIALKLTTDHPKNIEYIKLLGNCCHDLKQYDDAINCFRKALSINDKDFMTISNLASSLKEAKQNDEAEELFNKSLTINPNQADALTNYGLLLQTRGEIDEAVKLHQKALQLSPNNPAVLYNMAHASKEKGDKDTALKILNTVLSYNPNHLKALCDSAILYIDLQQPQRSRELLNTALQLAPDDENVHLGFYYMHKTAGDTTEAVSCLKEACRLNPDNTTSRYLLAIAEGNSSFESSPDTYVQELFDNYAETFDNHLVSQLQYRTPELINQTLRSRISPSTKYQILDLGCGTGLAGTHLKDIASHMTGVDLSPKMIKKAEERRIYDKLVVAGIEQFLDEYDFSPDITVSADVFVYIGDLEKIFQKLMKRMRPNGFFAFSTESTEDSNTFLLRDSGRFAHNQEYIKKLSDMYGFNTVEIHSTVLRYEAGKAMNGHVYLLQKTA